MTPINQWLIDRRIVCNEEGYPFSEARYGDLGDYVYSLLGPTEPTPAICAAVEQLEQALEQEG